MILIVEDDPQVARLISLVLQRRGIETEIVEDGQKALARAQEIRPTLIFADLSIRGMSGEALCVALKAMPDMRDIPYIVLSGDRDIAEKAQECGANDYMAKPFEFADLIQLIEKHARAESSKTD